LIGKLTGTIDAITEDGLLLDVNGVGYVVQASAKTMTRLGGPGTPASLLIETQMREDAITLFGFADAAEREWFRLLRSVQGVGGKVALAILSTLSPDDLTHAIAAQDKAAVARANGVGPKLAQRVVSELKDKAAGIGLGGALVGAAPPAAKTGEGGDLVNDAVSALVNLGYRRAEAYGAVSKVMSGAAAAKAAKPELNDLILGGLKELSQ
jgi:Holliday junction DNA helicase RuvA